MVAAVGDRLGFMREESEAEGASFGEFDAERAVRLVDYGG